MNQDLVLTSLESMGIQTIDGVDKINLNDTRKTKNERLVNFICGYTNRAINSFREALGENAQEHEAKITKAERAGLKRNTLNLVLIQKYNAP